MLWRRKMSYGIALGLLNQAVFALIPDPCKVNITSVFHRPTVATSACTTPEGNYTFETGVNALDFTAGGQGLQFPLNKIRIGLPARNELALIFPNELMNTAMGAGLMGAGVTFKHNIYYDEHWNTGVRVVFNPATGGQRYGTADHSYALNGIVSYHEGPLSGSVMLGYSSNSTPLVNGGARYTTFTPDGLVSWQAASWLQLFAEAYGQLHTGPAQGPGYNAMAGLIFLLNKDMAIDVEYAHRLSGQLADFRQYYGAGFSLMWR